jgi:rare lipoprotein A
VADAPAAEPAAPRGAQPLHVETGLASWYGPNYHSRPASSGEIYDQHGYTAAHRTLPLHTLVRVTNVKNGSSTLVRINDRGPFIEGRIIDLSLAAAQKIDVWRPGVAPVRVEVLEAPKPLDRGGRWAVQIGAFRDARQATDLRLRLEQRYRTARVRQFTGPTGEWLLVRVADDDRRRAELVLAENRTPQGAMFLVRLD